jgi:o-succinylbenzoate---CoA ligase
LDDWLCLRARTHADRPAIVAGGATVTYAGLDARAAATARRLAALGVGAGDRVATTLPASLPFAELLHALPRLGAVLVPVNTRLATAERRRQVEESGSLMVVEEPLEGPEADAELRARVRPDEPQTILFTSGTAGPPKPVPLSYRNHAASAVAAAWGLGVAPDDSWLCVLPVFHVGGLAILHRSAVYGTAAVLHERFDTAAAAAALRGGATLASLVPTMLVRLLDAGLERPPALRALLLGGDAVAPGLLRRAAAADLPVIRTYGMTETASQVATAAPRDEGASPLPGVSLRVAADGEILVRGPMVASGALAADGWLHTGDLGQLDGDGRLVVEGRRGEVIVTGGEKVRARAVEEVLLAHPRVVEAAVVGEPDAEWGEAVTAHVVLTGDPPPTDADLLEHCRAGLGGFEVPRRIRRVTELPRNAAGKVVRERLAARR